MRIVWSCLFVALAATGSGATDRGVDGIISDYPDRVLRALEASGRSAAVGPGR